MKGYTPPQMKLFHGLDEYRLRSGDLRRGPVPLPADQTAYFDTDFFQCDEPIRFQRWAVGPGVRGRPRVRPPRSEPAGQHRQGAASGARRARPATGVRTELQADCYAGVWAHYAAITKQPGTNVTYLEPLSDKDIADALSAASSVGDDRIQKGSDRPDQPERGPTGRPSNARPWFTLGYQTGDPKQCDTYRAYDLRDRPQA